ncbi:protein disulfide-isomerase domain protein [Teladorsagia circumcincta]|uniref:Protein disulfide-isomerase domain protein n=1 Tax=Teladorsagia circumcincta TaxID=45464 RepID=A0A2G9UL28_TELCI|nr:protein disulfide-isomerase domain protein [Teladorsagia circumcincta]
MTDRRQPTGCEIQKPTGLESEYKGRDEPYGIIDHMKELAIPAVKKLADAGSIDRFMEKEDVTIVGFFANEDSADFKAYSDAAEILREDFKSVGYTTDAKALEKFDAKPDDIIIFYPTIFHSKFEPKSRKLNKAGATPEELVSFIRNHCTPLVGKRTKENLFTRYNKLPLVVVYYNADFSLQYREGSEYWRQKVLKVAQKYEDKYRFAVADEEQFEDELRKAGLGDSGLEHNVIMFAKDGKKYPMDPKEFYGEFDENFEEFMEKISTGKAKPNITSAPVPINNKAPVRILVALNFDQVVGDESKDVLIEFYTPFKCGACKAFAPKYKELAKKLKKTQPNLVIAKFDANANDVPPEFPTPDFPAIYFAPSGKKSTPIKYGGDREEQDLIKFMELHAVKSFQKKLKEEL